MSEGRLDEQAEEEQLEYGWEDQRRKVLHISLVRLACNNFNSERNGLNIPVLRDQCGKYTLYQQNLLKLENFIF